MAVNQHWTNHEFALPKLPRGYEWKCYKSTDGSEKVKIIEKDHKYIDVKERSIVIMLGTK